MFKTLLFFYLLVGSGYLLKQLRVFKEKDVSIFVNYIIYFALPVAVFGTIHDFNFSWKDSLIFLTAWGTILISTFAVFFGFSKPIREQKTLKTLFLTCSFGNTAFVGYPIAYSLFGEKGLAYAIIYDVVGNFLFVVTVGIFLITGKVEWQTVYRFPPLGALILAFITKPFGIGFLKPFIATVKAYITPTIVFSLGLRFNPKGALKNLKLATLSVFWRQFFVPFLVLIWLLFLSKFVNLPKEETAVILLQSSMPPFVMSVILSEKFDLNTDLAIAAVNLGLLVLAISLPLWLEIFERTF
jgi:predicted permease